MDKSAESNDGQYLMWEKKNGETGDISYERKKRFSIEPSSAYVLVVDDDSTSLRIAERLLNEAGYQNVVLADNGSKALEILESQRFDIMLSNILMPGINGFELVQRVKQLYVNLSIFVMSNTEDLAIVYKCLKSGADHYLLKPLKENDVRGLWQSIWNRRRENRILAQLNQETTKSTVLEEKAIKLEQEIISLKKEMEEAVALPIRIIGKEVETLLSKSDLPAEIIVTTILRELRSVDIYHQAFQKFLEHSNDLEPLSRRWLIEVLEGRSMNTKSGRKKISHEWVHVTDNTSAVLRDWDFDVWSYTEEQLLPLCEDMFKDFELLDKFSIPIEKLRNLLLDVSANYSKQNPYHNFRHAFDVTQTVYLILSNANAATFLGYLEILALLLAALVHDLGHPGVNNNFQVVTSSQLALTYNDKSVLENFHSSFAFTLLKKPENDIFCNLTKEQRQIARTIIINSILATDLVLHVEILGKWNQCVESGFMKENKDHRSLLAQIILKCADIANPGKRFDQAKYWAQMVQEEFFAQGDMEKEKELSVSPFMDREKPTLPRMQINFIDFLVYPLFSSVKSILPTIDGFLKRLEENKKKWLKLETPHTEE